MLAKAHRRNHNFTIAYNLAGSCHTPDAAYALLCDLREDRQSAIDECSVQTLRNEAKMIRAKRMLENDDEAVRKDGKAEMLELTNSKKIMQVLLSAAMDELSFIDKSIAILQPLRKFSKLSDAESAEACQAEEWRLELLCRVENYMLTSGSIPADEFATMRQHPQFALSILPRITEIQELLTTPGGILSLKKQVESKTRMLEEIMP